jgi:hypothetical protein
MASVEFVGQSSRDAANPQAATSRLLNCYREPSQGRTPYVIKSVLGMLEIGTLPGTFARAAERSTGRSFIIFGGKLYYVRGDGTYIEFADVPDSVDSSISSNNDVVTFVAGGRYYTLVGYDVDEPTDGAFGTYGSVTFMGQRTILTERNGRRVQWSAVADPQTLDGLDFATTEQRDDNIIRALPIGPELWMFKETCIERWYQTDTGFAYIPGSLLDVGLLSFPLLTAIQSGAFFVGTDGKVYVAAGGLKPVSTPAVENAISTQQPISAFYYQDRGHEFCCITFAEGPAWCYDLTMGEWHERGQGSEIGPWLVALTWKNGGVWQYITNNGSFGRLRRVPTDLGGVLMRKMVSRTLQQEGKRFRVPELRFQGMVGADNPDRTLDELDDVLRVSGDNVLRVSGDGVLLVTEAEGINTPQVMLRVSGDHGQTWGQPRTQSLGDLGAYKTQIVYRALGQFRALTVELSCADEIDWTMDATAFLVVA